MLAVSLGVPWLLWPAVGLVAFGCVIVALAYRGLLSRGKLTALAAVAKCVALALLALCLIEPYLNKQRPRPGANVFVLLADNSQSLTVLDADGASRADSIREMLTEDQDWRTRLEQDFDTRHYQFDLQLAAAADFQDLDFEGKRSELNRSLETLADRYRNQPVAGVLVFSDGNITGGADSPTAEELGFPVYPVLMEDGLHPRDLSIRRVTVKERNFEAAPVTITAEVEARGFEETPVTVDLVDADGEVLQTKQLASINSETPASMVFQLPKVHFKAAFYEVRARASDTELPPAANSKTDADPQESADDEQPTDDLEESTLANNRQQIVVNPGSGDYRILYVGGRPNWEFKYIRRSVADDPELKLVGLMRIARRQPKFNFIRSGERPADNQLFKGFDNEDDDTAEQYDEPVLVRFSAKDDEELSTGFPKTAEDLFKYSVIMLDDIEAKFFTQDQLFLIREFVSRRGGSLIMLGGAESFANGRYDKTQLAELLPVYMNQQIPKAAPKAAKMSLTTEGWIEPWLRMRKTESEERNRLTAMPDFKTMNRVSGVKPGATVLAEAIVDGEARIPALVSQRFGNGRSAALLVGDMWRWGLERDESEPEDLQRSWRQLTRWLAADVPERVEVEVLPSESGHPDSMRVSVKVLDEAFKPLDNVSIGVEFEDPDGKTLRLSPEATSDPGRFELTYRPRKSGNYTATVEVVGPDGVPIATRQVGWVSQPESDEYRRLAINTDALERLAADTEGEVIQADELESFISSLPTRRVPVTEPWAYSLWHHGLTFSLIILALVIEWGIRRMNGLA